MVFTISVHWTETFVFWISWLFNKLLLFWHLQKKTQIKLKDGGEVMKATGALFSTPFYPTASCRS